MRRSSSKTVIAGFVTAACLLFGQQANSVSSELQIPELGDSSSSLFSSGQEYHLGRIWLMMFRNQAPIINDPLMSDYLEHLIYDLATHSQLKDRRLDLVVVDNKSMNAFAVPGGVVGVHNGMFLYAENEDQMSSVLCHELAHLSQRHFARGVEKQQRSSIPNLVALLGALVIAATTGGDAGIAAITATQAAAQQSALKFSRQNEQEADRIGMQTMVSAGLDPMSAAAMFEQMQRASRYYGRPPEFLLTHPVTESRIADARSRALRFPLRGPRDSFEYHLMKSRVLMYFEKNMNVAIQRFETRMKDDPTYKVAHRYGLVLALTKANRLDEAQAHMDILIKDDPSRITYLVTQAELWLAAGEPDKAISALQKQLRYNPNNHPLTMAYATALSRSRNPRGAEAILTEHALTRPNDPDLWYQLAEIRGQGGDILGVHEARAEYFVLMGRPEMAIRQLGYGLKGVNKNSIEAARLKQRMIEIQQWMERMEEVM